MHLALLVSLTTGAVFNRDHEMKWHLTEAVHNMNRNRSPGTHDQVVLASLPGNQQQELSALKPDAPMLLRGGHQPQASLGGTGVKIIPDTSHLSANIWPSKPAPEEGPSVTFLSDADDWFFSQTHPPMKALMFCNRAEISPFWQYMADAFG